MRTDLVYKLARLPSEFEAIHRLNYRTFVEEIPQHPQNAERRLVDRFHDENTYAICLAGDELVGMIAGRRQRPFSLDLKLPDLDAHLPANREVVEVRLLAVLPRYRKLAVFAHLAGLLARHFRAQGCDLAIISGTVRELRLYHHLGFRPFGPRVGTGNAVYQPMALTLDAFQAHASTLLAQGGAAMSLLPGPVQMRPSVARVAAGMRRRGYLVAHQSRYLVERNWLQVCLMGDWLDDMLYALPSHLARLLKLEAPETAPAT